MNWLNGERPDGQPGLPGFLTRPLRAIARSRAIERAGAHPTPGTGSRSLQPLPGTETASQPVGTRKEKAREGGY